MKFHEVPWIPSSLRHGISHGYRMILYIPMNPSYAMLWKGDCLHGAIGSPDLRTTQGLVPVLLRKRSAPHWRFKQDFFGLKHWGVNKQMTFNIYQHICLLLHQNVDGSPKIGAWRRLIYLNQTKQYQTYRTQISGKLNKEVNFTGSDCVAAGPINNPKQTQPIQLTVNFTTIDRDRNSKKIGSFSIKPFDLTIFD